MAPGDSQHELVGLLLSPDTYPHRPERIEHFQTPLSHVFVAEPYAYKLKKAVTLSFVDLGTRARREAICADEIRLNQRLCAPLYLGVRHVCRGPDGRLTLDRPDGSGESIEPLVWMRALPADGMLPTALERARVTTDLMRAFGRTLADFHRSTSDAAAPHGAGSTAAIRRNWDDVLANCAPAVGTIVSARTRDRLDAFAKSFLEDRQDLLRRRVAEHRIREGHGDLHASNLCLIEAPLPALPDAPGVPSGLYAFDCLEFSEELRWLDAASDVAFLAMDLRVRGHDELARAFVDSYDEHAGDADLPLVLPYYETFRALVRGMVHGQTARNAELSDDERGHAASHAREFFRYAERLTWKSEPPRLLAFCGLSGSGKTALAARVSDRTGFVHVSSDEIRKRGAGLDPLRAPAASDRDALYGREARERVYAEITRQASDAIRGGSSVVLDATFHTADQRAHVHRLAAELGVAALFIECRAEPGLIRSRLERRAAEPVPASHLARSDAGWEVHQKQAAAWEPLAADEPSIQVDTSPGDIEGLVEDFLERIGP